MKITLKKLTLRNFKGMVLFEKDFNPKEVIIRGANATGKTTIMDGFTFALFGKDSEDHKDFNIKTLDQMGEPIHYLDHEAEVILTVDDQEMTIKRVFKENWVKPRGTTETVLKGHETTYFINDVPMTMREFTSKIEAVCPESTFKLLTNPLYFPNMPWAEQRSMLFKIAGPLSDDDFNYSNEIKEMLSNLKGKTVEGYKKEIAASLKKIKEQKDEIPVRIDEVKRETPKEQDWTSIEKEIEDKRKALTEIDEQISNAASEIQKSGERARDLQNQINEKMNRRQSIEFDARYQANKAGEEAKMKFNELTDTIRNKVKELENLNNVGVALTEEGRRLAEEREKKLAEWHKINAEEMQIDENKFICPTCKRELPEDDIEQKRADMQKAFNDDKALRLADNVKAGREIATKIEANKQFYESNASAMVAIEEGMEFLKKSRQEAENNLPKDVISIAPILASHEEYNRLEKEINDLKSQVAAGPVKVDLTEYNEKKKTLQDAIDALKITLTDRTTIIKNTKRVQELIEEQSTLSQKEADLEKMQDTITAYNKTRVEVIEGRVNGKFKIVRFKLFNQQINGGEEETCEATVGGVPFSDLNSARKTQAGLDIINVIGDFFNFHAPIFIDNRESITEIPPMKSQVISLYVDPEYKELYVA